MQSELHNYVNYHNCSNSKVSKIRMNDLRLRPKETFLQSHVQMLRKLYL